MSEHKANRLARRGHIAALRHEQALAAAYKRVLNRTIRTAAGRFERFAAHAVTADASWHQPDRDQLVDQARLAAELEAATKRERLRVLRAVASPILEAEGVKFDLTNPLLQHVFEQMGGKITSIAEYTRQLIMDAVQDAYDAGDSIPDAARRIIGVEEMSRIRAERIARTELIGATQGGSLAAVQTTGAAKYKTWLTAGDDRVRPDHAAAEGQTVPVDTFFDVGGEQLRYPGDQDDGSADEVVNCRCVLTYGDDPGGVTASAEDGGTMSVMPREDWVVIDEYTKQRRHDYRGDAGAMCAICGKPADDGIHYGEHDESQADGTTYAPISVGVPLDSAPAGLDMVQAGAEWEAVLLVEGVSTDDGRRIAPGAVEWRELPLTLMAMVETQPRHDGATVSGRIDSIWRDGNQVKARGVFDSGLFGAEITRLVGEKTLRGVSVDLAVKERELTRGDGSPLPEGDDAQLLDILQSEDVVETVTKGVIMAATICPTPAFADASIRALSEDGLIASGIIEIIDPTLTASAAGMAPVEPPREWFFTPEADEPTVLTVTDEGQIYGHVATWGVCHIGITGYCQKAPRSRSGYSYFNVGVVRCDDGSDVYAGKLTLGKGHATSGMGLRAATEHYDDSRCVVGDVRVVDGEHGIWMAGALRPELSASKVRELRAATVSGDWRPVSARSSDLEMVGVLCVNVSGFPIPRPEVALAALGDGDEHVLSLVAAGIVSPGDDVSDDDVEEALAEVYVAAGLFDRLLERLRD